MEIRALFIKDVFSGDYIGGKQKVDKNVNVKMKLIFSLKKYQSKTPGLMISTPQCVTSKGKQKECHLHSPLVHRDLLSPYLRSR